MQNSDIMCSERQKLFNMFDVLRFPMAFLVVMIHCQRYWDDSIHFEGLSGDTLSINALIQYTFSDLLPSCAVPIFFMISGYLFFANMRQWDWSLYHSKMKRRIHTLLIPYILWISLAILETVAAISITSTFWGKPWHRMIDWFSENGWLRLYWDCYSWSQGTNLFGVELFGTSPTITPLWYVRDLIVCVLMIPLIYLIVNKLKIWGG